MIDGQVNRPPQTYVATSIATVSECSPPSSAAGAGLSAGTRPCCGATDFGRRTGAGAEAILEAPLPLSRSSLLSETHPKLAVLVLSRRVRPILPQAYPLLDGAVREVPVRQLSVQTGALLYSAKPMPAAVSVPAMVIVPAQTVRSMDNQVLLVLFVPSVPLRA